MNYKELKEKVIYHCKLYYDDSTPEITDIEFDNLYDLLNNTEKAQGWADSDSPTFNVGGSAGKVTHTYPLYSLKKVYDIEEVDPEFKIKTPKLDGTNLTITYRKNKVHVALTRGDGEMGEDVTHLVKYIEGIPQVINYIESSIVVITGECVTDNEVENFRNYVSGAIGLKDPEEFKDRNIRFIAHNWLNMNATYTARMKLLKAFGFNTVMEEDFCSEYPQDGIVYRVDSYNKEIELGHTSKYPRYSVALKARGVLTATSTLQDVIWVVGRTGTVNPVGIIEPVVIDDATITRITLHNLEFIEKHDLGLGDVIELERAGGIIPKFNRVIQSSEHNTKIKKRHAEQAIGGACKRVGPRLYCVDASQHGTVKLLEHFIKTLGIKGLGPQSVTKLDLSHPVDLYQEQVWDSLGKNGIKIIEEIERSKTKPYSLVLAALGIPGVGKSMARNIVQHIPTFHKLRDIETMQITGIGPKISENILAWLEINEGWVDRLPLQLTENQSVESLTDTKGLKKICVTGKLNMTKNELAEELKKYGVQVTTTVTKDCYALITDGRKDSVKYKKAEQYGIKIIDYWGNYRKILNGEF